MNACKFRLWCEHDDRFEYVIAMEEPALCPVDSAHGVRPGSAALVSKTVDPSDPAPRDLPLEYYKAWRHEEIDARTDELIAAGFTFAGKQFSLSLSAQSKMTAAHMIREHALFAYPVNWNTIDDQDEHTIADAAELEAFYLTAIGTIRAILDSGTGLKAAIRVAGDVATLEAIQDPR